MASESEKMRIVLLVFIERVIELGSDSSFEGRFEFRDRVREWFIAENGKKIPLYRELALCDAPEFLDAVRGIAFEK
jgi:hypothetical protein